MTKTATETSTLPSTLHVDPRVDGILVEVLARTWAQAEVNDRVNLYVAVKLKVWVKVLVGVNDLGRPPKALCSTRLERVDQNKRSEPVRPLASLQNWIVACAAERILVDPLSAWARFSAPGIVS